MNSVGCFGRSVVRTGLAWQYTKRSHLNLLTFWSKYAILSENTITFRNLKMSQDVFKGKIVVSFNILAENS